MENRPNHPQLRCRPSSKVHRDARSKAVSRSLLHSLLGLGLIWMVPALACGSFQPRDTPTSTPPPVEQVGENQADQNTGGASNEANSATASTPIPEVPTATPLPLPTPTFTVTPLPGTVLQAGQPARIVAPNGLNMRSQATSSSQLVLQLGTGQLVTVLDGPVSADGFTWWQVEDQQGSTGWVADGDNETVWVSPSIGEPQPVGRPPQVGDRVRVTMEDAQLTIRALPGTDGPLITRANPGEEFTVVNGPQSANGYSWYQIRSDNGSILGWAADSDLQREDRWLSPIE